MKTIALIIGFGLLVLSCKTEPKPAVDDSMENEDTTDTTTMYPPPVSEPDTATMDQTQTMGDSLNNNNSGNMRNNNNSGTNNNMDSLNAPR